MSFEFLSFNWLTHVEAYRTTQTFNVIKSKNHEIEGNKKRNYPMSDCVYYFINIVVSWSSQSLSILNDVGCIILRGRAYTHEGVSGCL